MRQASKRLRTKQFGKIVTIQLSGIYFYVHCLILYCYIWIRKITQGYLLKSRKKHSIRTLEKTFIISYRPICLGAYTSFAHLFPILLSKIHKPHSKITTQKVNVLLNCQELSSMLCADFFAQNAVCSFQHQKQRGEKYDVNFHTGFK